MNRKKGTRCTEKKCTRTLLACAAALLCLFTLGPSELSAQAALVAGTRFIAQQRAISMDVMPDKGEGSDILGYAGGTKFAGLSEKEINAFLNSPRNWFQSVGKGGDPGAKPVALDGFAKVLSEKDAEIYRSLFKAIAAQDFHAMPGLTAQLDDRLLLGHIEAARLLFPASGVKGEALREWLTHHADLPEARDIYEKAVASLPSERASLPKASDAALFTGSVERADGGGTMIWDTDGLLKLASAGKEGKAFVKALRAGKITEASALLEQQKEAAGSNGQDLAARVTLAETLLRRGKGKEGWTLVRAADIHGAPGFDAGSKAYAFWVKGLCAFTGGDMLAAREAFASLTSFSLIPPNRAAAHYWAARAAERLGDNAGMNAFLQKAAAQPRSFYGLLALSRLGHAPHYNWNAPSFTQAQAALLKSEPAGNRALALLQIGERTLAEAELRTLPVRGKDKLQNALLGLVVRYTLPSLAVQVGSALSKNRTLDAALYPLMPWQPEGSYVSDPALVLALARNESHFNHTARSPVGATGVMQIMPQTAESIRAGTSARLYEPGLNVTLGDRYIDMLTRTEGIGSNLLFIIGSYNCGPGRMLDLFKASKDQNGEDPLLFVETLPIKETRDYIQKVMATYWIYRARFNKPLKAMAELTIGLWPTYRRGDNVLVSAE